MFLFVSHPVTQLRDSATRGPLWNPSIFNNSRESVVTEAMAKLEYLNEVSDNDRTVRQPEAIHIYRPIYVYIG